MTEVFEASAERLTQAEMLIWMGQQLSPGVPLYNMVLTFRIRGPLDVGAFRRGFAALVASSDALRTRVIATDGVPRRQVEPVLPQVLEEVDATGEAQPEAWLARFCAERAQRVFSLSERLFDAALVRVGPEDHLWFFNQHHLITDGWSTALCFDRLVTAYRAARNAAAPETGLLPPMPQYSEYVTAEAQARGGPALAKALAHWRAAAERPFQPSRFYGHAVARRSARTERVTWSLGAERTARLKEVAVDPRWAALTPGLSQFQVFAAVLLAWMHRVGGGDRDLTILAPTHNRPGAALKQTVGLFIEVFPMHVHLGAGETFAELLGRLQQESRSFLAHAVPGSSAPVHARGYDVLLNFIQAAFGDFAGLPMESEWVHPGHGDPSHSLRLQVHDFAGDGDFTLHFDFNCDVFGVAERDAAVRHFGRLLDALLADPGQRLEDVDLLSAEERTARIQGFNETARSWPHATVLDGFRRQVEASPDAIALSCDGTTLRYRDLDALSNRFAHALRARGVVAGTVVAMVLDRSIEFVGTALGVLKAGGAYLPIDPTSPPARIELLLRDSGAVLVVAGDGAALGADLPCPVFHLDRESAGLDAGADGPLADAPGPGDPAYVIYTSGSTGRPKGVVVSHGSLAQYAQWAASTYTDGRARRFAFFSPVAVDLTVTSIYVPLVSGGEIVVYPADEGPHDLAVLRVFAEDAVDIVKLTPAHLSLLLQQGDLASRRLRVMIVGGEDFQRRLAQRVQDAFGERVAIYNEYGPTEATVGCMIHRFDEELDTAASVPIGRPIANARIYLLDDRMRPVPAGVPGELWVGGLGVAEGYLGQPDWTAERFREDPFVPGARVYRTGDLGREDPATGLLVFAGRIDDQVKIRGARVELAEVQARLEEHPGVAECVVHVGHRQGVVDAEAEAQRWRDVRFCARCGLADNHPDAELDRAGICNVCREFDGYRVEAQRYFRSLEDLRQVFHSARAERAARGQAPAEFDCLMLLSGGKDSSYALHQLVEMGLKVLVFSLDNGYISDSAKANIRKICDNLNLELVFSSTPAMNAIFADSLERFSNVCQGCFKAIYTLSTGLAKARGISHIVTGLSRGQIFETRLAGFFRNGVFDPAEIDRQIIEARKAYHRADDVVARHLDVGLFADDQVFEEVQFVDFYRYCEVPLEEVLHFLTERASWSRPKDTGRSTNCLINDIGIDVHKAERGFHNYALPYSWDVRLGHKTRDECLDELQDEIDPDRVQRILREVGYVPKFERGDAREARLVAYYVPKADGVPVAELREFFTASLPAFMVPQAFVRLDALPLAPSGKVDRAALPDPESVEGNSEHREQDYVAPRNDVEARLVDVWQRVLGVERVGIRDDFVALGGDSILNIQIVARARAVGLRLTPRQVFEYPTVAELAQVAVPTESSPSAVEVTEGPVPMTPIQRWFFAQGDPHPDHFGQSLVLATAAPLDLEALRTALRLVVARHDALRLTFAQDAAGAFHATVGPVPAQVPLAVVSGEGLDGEGLDDLLTSTEAELHAGLSLGSGCLLRGAVVQGGPAGDRLLLVAHHLGVDAVSWSPILADLETVYRAAAGGRGEPGPEVLPRATVSWRRWAEHLDGTAVAFRGPVWSPPADLLRLPVDAGDGDVPAIQGSSEAVEVRLPAAETLALQAVLQSSTGLRLPEVILAALTEALVGSGADRAEACLRIDVEGHGRDMPGEADEDLYLDNTRTVGWFTTLYPITATRGPTPVDTLRAIRDAMGAVPDGGHGHGLANYGPEGTGDPVPADVVFNYLGRADAFDAGLSVFRCERGLAVQRGDQAPRSHLLDVYGRIEADALVITLGFSADRHRRETVERWGADLVAALRTLAGDPVRILADEVSPTQFPAADLSQSELDDLLDEFGD